MTSGQQDDPVATHSMITGQITRTSIPHVVYHVIEISRRTGGL